MIATVLHGKLLYLIIARLVVELCAAACLFLGHFTQLLDMHDQSSCVLLVLLFIS